MIFLAEFWYNSSHHSSLACSPVKALYGTDPTAGFLPASPTDDSTEVGALLQDRAAHSVLLQHQLAWAQHKMKKYAYLKRSHREFQEGEQVLLKLQPYAQHSVISRPSPSWPLSILGHTRSSPRLVNWLTNWTWPIIDLSLRIYLLASPWIACRWNRN